MSNLISVYKPTIKRKDLEYVLNCMMHDKVDYGDFARNFEKRLEERIGIKYAIAINSFFNALYLIFEALEIKEGDEIILPSFSPQIFLNVIKFKKAVPVLVDLEKESLKPSLEGVKNAITEKTKALILKYHFGYIFDPQPYIELIPNTIEDITSVLGAKIDEVAIGLNSSYAVSDFSSKGLITTGEGAGIFCNKKNEYTKLYSLLEIDYTLDYTLRISCLMPDLNAAMGVSQDETLNHKLILRKKIGEFYEDAIRRSHRISLIHNEYSDRIYSDFPAVFKSGLKEIIKYFRKNNIEVIKPFNYPLHQYLNLSKSNFQNTEYFYLKTLIIPNYSSLVKKEVNLIAKVLSSII